MEPVALSHAVMNDGIGGTRADGEQSVVRILCNLFFPKKQSVDIVYIAYGWVSLHRRRRCPSKIQTDRGTWWQKVNGEQRQDKLKTQRWQHQWEVWNFTKFNARKDDPDLRAKLTDWVERWSENELIAWGITDYRQKKTLLITYSGDVAMENWQTCTEAEKGNDKAHKAAKKTLSDYLGKKRDPDFEITKFWECVLLQQQRILDQPAILSISAP